MAAGGPALDRTALIALRKEGRRRLTRLHTEFMNIALLPETDPDDLREKAELAEGLAIELKDVDLSLIHLWTDDEREKEMEAVGDYRDKVREIATRFSRACRVRGSTTTLIPTSSGTAAINDNPDLSGVQKLEYLQGAVTGPAAKAIAVYTLTEDNFKNAWSALERQYGRPRTLNTDSIACIRDLFNTCTAYIRGLEALSVDVDAMNSVLTSMILCRIPREIAIKFEMLNSVTIPLVSDLMNFLEKQLLAIETVDQLDDELDSHDPSNAPPSLPKPEERGSKKSRIPTTSALVVNTNQSPGSKPADIKKSQRKRPFPCVYCNQNGHWSADCSQGHPAQTCSYFRQACHLCGQKHYPSLCPAKNQASNNTITICPSPLTSETSDVAALNLQVNHFSTTVILGTASVWLIGEEGKVQARLMRDDGSMVSFVREETARRVGAKKLGNVAANVAPFGELRGTTTDRSVYELHLQPLMGGRIITVTVLGDDVLCRTLPILTDPDVLR
uniref:CCHC-type domain-containing protein n=1 Tax=Strigamia maritima TaxID=126957 RepID=T1ILH5_STRMM